MNEKVLEYCGADAFGKDPTEAIKLADKTSGVRQRIYTRRGFP